MLDQAEEVGPGRRQGTADVVLGQPAELPEQRLSNPAQLVVEVLLRKVIDHEARACQTPFSAATDVPLCRERAPVRRGTFQAGTWRSETGTPQIAVGLGYRPAHSAPTGTRTVELRPEDRLQPRLSASGQTGRLPSRRWHPGRRRVCVKRHRPSRVDQSWPRAELRRQLGTSQEVFAIGAVPTRMYGRR